MWNEFHRTTFFALTAILLAAAGLARAQDLQPTGAGAAGEFLRMGSGARALAMGGTFTAIADDASSVFWNPAGLGYLRKLEFEFTNVNLPLDRSQNFLTGAFPIGGFITVGIGWLNFKVDNIEGRNGDSSQPDFLFGNAQNAFFLSLSKSFGSRISFGGSLKFLRQQLHASSASGMGFDVGTLIRATENLTLAFMVQDINSHFQWNDTYREPIPETLRTGGAWRFSDNLLVAAGFDKTSGRSMRFHLGGEFRLLDIIPLRIGLDHDRFTAGTGIGFDLSGHALDLNYGISNEPVIDAAVHRFSIVFRLGRNSGTRVTAGKLKPTEVFAIIKAAKLNVRSGPGVSHERVAQVTQGENFKALDKKGDWRAIQLYSGKIGWVHARYITLVNL